MTRLERAVRRFRPKAALRIRVEGYITAIDADLPPAGSPEAPQINLPHVDTQLNMHQFNGFFDDGNTTDSQADSHTSQPQPPHPNPNPATSPQMNAEAPTEWSAVGHAATGKSGRVIHGLQEDIARLTRECTLYRSRAEETQRSNEALKTQVQNLNERLRNLEQVNETNLNSISRKDRKMEELRSELHSERTKRQVAEADTSKTNEIMRAEREKHHREQARTIEISKFHETQYEALAATTKRDKTDLTRRLRILWDEVKAMAAAQKNQTVNTQRLDVLADQKNREMEIMRENHEKLLANHAEYKKMKENELREIIERAHANNTMIETAVASIKATEAEMKWAIQVNNNNNAQNAPKG